MSYIAFEVTIVMPMKFKKKYYTQKLYVTPDIDHYVLNLHHNTLNLLN